MNTFKTNLAHINLCDLILARIDGYDADTVWELGYAFAIKKPVFAYTITPNKKDALMTTESGIPLLHGFKEIDNFLAGYIAEAKPWPGKIG